jgi:hypothetical protein
MGQSLLVLLLWVPSATIVGCIEWYKQRLTLVLAGVGKGNKGAVALSEVDTCLHALHQA